MRPFSQQPCIAASVSLPAFAGLTDAEKRSAMKKLAGAIKRRKEVGETWQRTGSARVRFGLCASL